MNKDIKQLSKDLATFKNPPIEDIPKIMCDAIESGMESVKIMTEELIKAVNGDIEQLKPCPFCGGKAEYNYADMIGDTYSESGEVHSIDCLECGVYIHVDNLERNNTTEVYEKWNRRI